MVQVSELHFSTEDGIKVLEDVHLHVERGEMIFLLGPAASGKTLLFGLLGAQIPPQHGQILVHGRNITRLGRDRILDLQRRIGFLPQGFQPLRRSVLENVLFKLRALGDFREQAEEKAMLSLERVGLLKEQSTDATDLASIDRVRLGLALATCNDPLLLLLDDLFAGLDASEQEEICRLLEQMHIGNKTILCAARAPLPLCAHRYPLVRIEDGAVRAS